MTKKRVYELAKELGIDNKELISRLEKLGIAVKSPSSGLEDNDVEKVRIEFQLGEPLEMVEQRIKSTVIRRRAVRPVVEEVKHEPSPVQAEITTTSDEEKIEKIVAKDVKKEKVVPKEVQPKAAVPVEVTPETTIPEAMIPTETITQEKAKVETQEDIQKKPAAVAEEIPKKVKKKIEAVEKKPAPPIVAPP
ncbi:MAG: translation initiation factor IF-2 N-terminal domain-containing protein, partial [Deltaproteobacteria bacterium]|nr:translation initiation factor IF-2 N-terminal domain-containing protein [Deltaproteobacteria bacterium]